MKSRLFFVLITLMLAVGCGKKESDVSIWDAAANGNIEAIKQHLDAGTDINGTFILPGTPGSGGTPLHVAVLAGQMEATKLLLKKGADINARADDVAGGTPLHWAAVIGSMDFAEVLVEAGADVNAGDSSQAAPLHWAAVNGQTEAAGLLIENGAGVDVKNNDGSTALHVAAFFCHTEIVKLLLEKGADVNARNLRSETPLDTVAASWSPALEETYRYIAGLIQIEVDLEKIKVTRPKIAAILREHVNITDKTKDNISDVDANIKILSGNATYTLDDRALLAKFCAKALESDPIKAMRVD